MRLRDSDEVKGSALGQIEEGALTWDHRDQSCDWQLGLCGVELNKFQRPGSPGIHSHTLAEAYKVLGWLIFARWVVPLQEHCGNCSKVLCSGMKDSAVTEVGSLTRQ